MTHAFTYRRSLLDRLTRDLQKSPSILAAWEGGSASNAALDEFSDIDLNLLVSGDPEAAFLLVEKSLRGAAAISHTWNEPKSLWPDLTQKVYFLADAPKHFFVDVATFPDTAPAILDEFMQTERHGAPIVLFDKVGRIVGRATDRVAIKLKQQKRVAEIEAAYPVYRETTLKALARGQAIDSFHFYQAGMVRPTVELLGIVYRPFQFDFGYRYLERSLPGEIFRQLEPLLFVPDLATLRARVVAVDAMFNNALPAAKAAALQL
jgi:hypothetical protein